MVRIPLWGMGKSFGRNDLWDRVAGQAFFMIDSFVNGCLEYHRPIITLVQQNDPQNRGAQSLYSFPPKFSEVGNSNCGIAWVVGAKA